MGPVPIPRWLAILACLIASAVPAAGVVVCLHDGALEIGIGDDCPCDLPADHSDCHHFDVDGGGEPVVAAPRVPPPAEVTSLERPIVAVEPEDAARPSRRGRAPPVAGAGQPGPGRAERPWIARHLEVRSTTSLLV